MKKVIIKQLTLENFRGVKSLTVNFNPVETTISGGNNTGKSTIMNAFMWLLFGKDADDRKDFNIKRLVNGKTIDKTDVKVSAILDVGGEETTLSRSFVERWTKPRGQVEEVFKGNETQTSFNDVPINVSEYQKRINEIIDENAFKMVTNPLYFSNMKWQDQREVLFQIAGAVTDDDVASRRPEFTDLLNQISGKSLSDFKREIYSKKRKAKQQLENIQPRIDQTQKLMPESKDFAKIEESIEKHKKSLSKVEEALENASKTANENYKKQQDKIENKIKLQQQQRQIIFDANEAERERVYKADTERRELSNMIKITDAGIKECIENIEKTTNEIKEYEKSIIETENKIVSEREKWKTENAREYRGETKCQTCRQELPETMIEEAVSLFNESKRKKLIEINTYGRELSNDKSILKNGLEEAKEVLKKHEKALDREQSEYNELSDKLDKMEVVYALEVKPESLPEWVKLQKQIDEIEKEIEQPIDIFDTTELKVEKSKLQDEIREMRDKLRDRDLIKNYKKEIEKLDAEGKELAQIIAELERTEFTIKSFTKTKIEESEKRINSLFKHVTFQLFDYTIDGNEFETCIPLVSGVPFPVANTAGALNAGLDIINTLTNFYGVSAPIFIDNREGVNDIIETNSQIINLVVTRDKNLIIN